MSLIFWFFVQTAAVPAYAPSAPRMIYYDLNDAEPSLVLRETRIAARSK